LPGYSGVENPLYDNRKTIFLQGDAKETANNLFVSLRRLQDEAYPAN
jgi:NAD/NADP transhydrogenase beta subunit